MNEELPEEMQNRCASVDDCLMLMQSIQEITAEQEHLKWFSRNVKGTFEVLKKQGFELKKITKPARR